MKQATIDSKSAKLGHSKDHDPTSYVDFDIDEQYALLNKPPLSRLRYPPVTMYKIQALLKKRGDLLADKRNTNTFRRHTVFSKAWSVLNQPSVDSVISTVSIWRSESQEICVRQRHTCTAYKQSLVFYGGCTSFGTALQHPILIYQIATKTWITPSPQLEDFQIQITCDLFLDERTSQVSSNTSTEQTINSSNVDVSDQPSAGKSSEALLSFTSPDKMAADVSSSENSAITNEISEHLPDSIENRYSHTAVLFNQYIYIFGGVCTQTGQVTNSILVYDIFRNVWKILDTADVKPAPRKNHIAVLVSKHMYVWGGRDTDSSFNDMWKYDFESNRWHLVQASGTVPSPRYSHAATVFNSRIWIYGGCDGSKELSEFVCFNTLTLSWSVITPHPESTILLPMHSHTLSIFEDKIILTGGSNPRDSAMLDVYVYFIEKNRWTRVEYVWVPTPSEASHVQGRLTINTRRAYKTSSSHQSRSRRDMSSKDILAKKNRIFHSCAIPAGPSCTAYIFGGTSSHTSSRLDCIYFEFEQESHMTDKKLSSLPKKEWEAAAMSCHPDVLALSEKLCVLTGTPSYVQLVDRADITQALDTLNNKQVLMMVSEWLAFNGYKQTLARLCHVTSTKYIKPSGTGGSILDCLLSFAKRMLDDDTNIWSQDVLSHLVNDSVVENFDHLSEWRVHSGDDPSHGVNIWEELINCNNLILEGDNVTYASLNVLIQLILGYIDTTSGIDISEKERNNFLKQFFYTYHIFITPEFLLEKIIQLYAVPVTSIAIRGKMCIHLHRLSVLRLLEYWMINIPWDWEVKRLRMRLKNFLESSQIFSKTSAGLMSKVRKLKLIISKFANAQSLAYNSGYEAGTEEPFRPDLPKELLNKWVYRQEPDYHAHNLRVLLSYSSRLTEWTRFYASRYQMGNLKLKLKQLDRLLKIAGYLKAFRNFQGLYAVLIGLESSISQSQKSFKKVFNTLKASLIGPSSFLSHFNSHKPCIPLLEHIRQDFQKVLQSSNDSIGSIFVFDGIQQLIDISKCAKLKAYIDQFIGLQFRRYNFISIHQIAVLVQEIGHPPDATVPS
ncbi:ras guanine nucleotide exchange factor F-like isoform X2 [Schistocerca gregaria]|uniref:ras guanine nucleotide exchange factor F-like isoform X2 n=1 Tax=Schistocerca gregaria TaxID=7010 RepID=UPI00211E8EDA|nr:ras guanine nucleotide exchange factor F-like isoform X2 [Schistocerca gregaria]